MGVTLLLLDFLLNRNNRLFFDRNFLFGLLDNFRIARRARLKLFDEAVKIDNAMLQRINKEADQGQLIGHPLKIALLRDIAGICKPLDFVGTLFDRSNSGIMPHHSQSTHHLAEWHIETWQIGTFFGIAEETVENLFDLGEIALDFFGNLTDQQLFLRKARHFVEERNFRSQLRWSTGQTALNSGNGNIDLVSKILTQALKVILGILRKQNRRCNFHGQHFGMARFVLGQPIGRGRNRLRQSAEICLPDLIDNRRQNVGILLEQGERLHSTRTVFAPCFLGSRDHVAQLAPHSFLRRRSNRLFRRDKRMQLVGITNRKYRLVIAIRIGDKVEHIAHQALGNVFRTFKQTTYL